MTTPKYPKIQTLFKRDENHRVTDELKDPIYGTINAWLATEKVDGTNIRLTYTAGDHEFHLGGRTDNAQIPAPLTNFVFQRRARIGEVLRANAADHGLQGLVVFGEGFGPKIQSGGDYRDQQELILFDVLALGENRNFWLTQDTVTEYAEELGIPRVPTVGLYSLDEMMERVRAGIKSKVSVRPRMAEGLVARPVEPLYRNNGRRLILKLKTQDFAS